MSEKVIEMPSQLKLVTSLSSHHQSHWPTEDFQLLWEIEMYRILQWETLSCQTFKWDWFWGIPCLSSWLILDREPLVNGASLLGQLGSKMVCKAQLDSFFPWSSFLINARRVIIRMLLWGKTDSYSLCLNWKILRMAVNGKQWYFLWISFEMSATEYLKHKTMGLFFVLPLFHFGGKMSCSIAFSEMAVIPWLVVFELHKNINEVGNTFGWQVWLSGSWIDWDDWLVAVCLFIHEQMFNNRGWLPLQGD